jgi:hypothetical protein
MSLLSQGYKLFMVETWEEVLLHGTLLVFALRPSMANEQDEFQQ